MMQRRARSACIPLKALPRMVRQASVEWFNDNAPRLSASVAFYTLLSLAPLIVIALAVAALAYGPELVQGRLTLEMRELVGPDVARIMQNALLHADQPRTGVIATLLSLIMLLFGASSVFIELRDAMNTIWHVPLMPEGTPAATMTRLIRDRYISFATVIGSGILLLGALLLNAWATALRISVPPAAAFSMASLVVALLFAALYKLLPDVSLRWSDVALSALITSLLFMIGKHAIGLYFAHASFGSTYGAAGSPVVVLLWVYYSAQLFFWGAEFSKVYAKTFGSRRAYL